MYPAARIPAGSEMTAMPMREESMVIARPAAVTGQMSPYPTVVRDMAAQ